MSEKAKVAISVKNVVKDFKLPVRHTDSVKDAILQSLSLGLDKYRTRRALDGVSFNIKKGEFFGILGRNGTGKSTLLKILSEIYQPTSGSVKVNGKLVPFIELGVGFNPKLSGRENVYLNGAMLGFSKSEIDEKYEGIVDFAELEEFMDQKLKNYSSGMRVRLAFAIAIQSDSDILVIDEVLAVGDADFRKKCYKYFQSLKDNPEKTIVFVTHGMGAVRDYCDRAIIIENGKIAFEGSGEEAADEYNRLFESSAILNKGGDPGLRRGDGSVYVESLNVDDVNKKSIKLTITLKSDGNEYRNVKFGFRFLKQMNGKYVRVAGVSNRTALVPQRLDFKKNETKIIKAEVDNMFGNGTFYISTTVTRDSGSITCDNWERVVSLNNTKDDIAYPVLVSARLSVMRNGERNEKK